MNIRLRRLNANLVPRAWLLARKLAYQNLLSRRPQAQPAKPIFLVGCQRSGTTLTLTVLGKSLDSWYYHPDDERAFHNHRLRDDSFLKTLLDKSRARFVVFKPLTEMQQIGHYLEQLPELKVVWLYRQFDDVVNSTVTKWGEAEHLKDVMQRFRDRAWDRLKWRGEQISDDALATIDRCFGPDSTEADAAALWWHYRSQLYFNQQLDQSNRVKLFKYDDLVEDPPREYRKMYDFSGMSFSSRVVSGVHATSKRKQPPPELAPAIRELCEELLSRFDRIYAQQQSPSVDGPT